MGKALGGAMGGYTTGPADMIALLRQKARPYLFSNTLPPAVVGATSRVFEMITADTSLVEKVCGTRGSACTSKEQNKAERP